MRNACDYKKSYIYYIISLVSCRKYLTQNNSKFTWEGKIIIRSALETKTK